MRNYWPWGYRSPKKVHVVASQDLVLLLTRFLENEGFTVTGAHSTYGAFLEDLQSREVDLSATVLIEGDVGLALPTNPDDIVGQLEQIRKRSKSLRIVVLLEYRLQENIEMIRKLVHMGIHDLQFVSSYKGEDVLNWIRERKTTRDYYAILGRPRRGWLGLLGRGKENIEIAASSDGQGDGGGRTGGGNIGGVPEKPLSSIHRHEALPSGDPVRVQASSSMPLLIGLCGAGGEEDVGAAVFLLAAGLARLGWKPLVCGEDRPEIGSLEELAFRGEKEDRVSTMFEYEGVTFYRRDRRWDISELMIGPFTHIILWIDLHRERPGMSSMEQWLSTSLPMMVANGAMWKYELLKERLGVLNRFERKRCRLLLENGQQQVLHKLHQDYEELKASLIPETVDPLYPGQEAVDWVSGLLAAPKKQTRQKVLLWLAIAGVFIITIVLIGLGLSFSAGNGE